jgi:CubicO group peptidase (beta-lactamase class C family)
MLAFLIAPAARAADANADLGRYADQLISRAYPAGGPGAAVLIAKDGEVLLRKGYGLANLELGVPVRPETVFEIASVTKQFTAAAILLLQERGRLSMNDDITKYLPDYPTHGRTITIDQLLAHTSGIPNVTSLPEWWPRRREDLTLQELIGLFKDKPLDFNPGEKQSYSNSGYILLGAIIEKASGKRYEEFVEQEILAPLGMKHSRLMRPDEVVPEHAAGYDQAEDGYMVAQFISRTQPYAAGGLLSTVDDLALWADALSSGKLLKQESLASMATPAKLASGEPLPYAYGQGLLDEAGTRIIEHGGGIPGFNAELLRVPDQRLVVIILSNSLGHDPAPGALAFRITMKALGKAVEERKAVDLDPATLDEYTGTYLFDATTSGTISREGNRLFARRAGSDEHEILAASRDDFFYRPEESHSRIRFRRDAQGKVTGMEFLQTFEPGAVGMKVNEPLPAGPPEIPKTPAGRVFAAWLTSFNSGDPAQFRAFDATYRSEAPPPIEGRLAFREGTGGFTLLRVETSEPLSIVVLLQEKSSDQIAKLDLKVSSDEMPKMVSSTIEPARRPADLAIPRLTEAGALAALTASADDLAKKDQFSGVLLVVRHGKVLLQKAWGQANRETGAPVTLDTRFRIGSMNKMFNSSKRASWRWTIPSAST